VAASTPSRYICLICRNPIPHAGAECSHCQSRLSAVVGATPGLLAAVFAVMAGLFYLTHQFDRAFDETRLQRGRDHYALAEEYAEKGDYDQAVNHYREALLHERDEPRYRLGMATALFEAGRFQEAEPQLLDLRAIDPTDAVAHRLLARIARRAGRTEAAVGYYRSAVYGRWPSDPARNRIETRFELIDLLEGRPGRRAVNDLIAVLQEETPTNELVRRVADRLRENGAYDQAVERYRRLREAGVEDFDVELALADSLVRSGDYLAAREAAQRARRLGRSPDLNELAALLDRAYALDPSRPRIGTNERFRRGRETLQRAVALIDSCLGGSGVDFVGPRRDGMAEVFAVRSRAVDLLADERPRDRADAAERASLAAVELWGFRDRACTGTWDEDEPLGLVIERLDR